MQIYPEGFLLVSKGGFYRNHRNPSRSATAAYYGGGILSYGNGYIHFKEKSTMVFSNNTAHKGEAILADGHCRMTLDYNSSISFGNNTASFGATIFWYT